ncbi:MULTISPECIES: hypothetical protein [unclassified Sulfuricurvum]|uniref:hypothetical protein n=1 Tax=unclassified Sulfuricurvum TaxID=2632390 RepID=UPI00029989A1|nr:MULTISPECIES: hypothetical protein [unclassified Sulfuricurvum]OHD84874.1 MAG: hypothetical protein A3D90_03480 [Sulfuricurvum sp. RIFCSPHIGHO2_02_FULL_43_9]OHD86098.1 MAG: hypothetical protein A3I60_07055 [Sulfuricurvum sp. RIFCSPLOWO2_02_FULL_43_45]OHD86178.1 MAG: hypothetical protein A3J39_10785 [Sulfuricurvum sp. RIFCSPHIGHO2_12_FULL_44_8]OHD86930.1 MAG: hypothetical protein A2Y52_07775 [Sulfuricurvum sp. RIFCSPLOWO2_02_43_6]OHD92045.1 MAG: hypothetical protein A2W83_00510 [Sulfuricurvu
MHGIEKYDNLKDVIPKLQSVLAEAIQSEFLEIKKIDKECEKFITLAEHIPELSRAEYVIFSHHIKKNEHKNEIFVFIDAEGGIVRHVSGREMELYGLLEPCATLHVSDEYQKQQEHA